MSHHTETHEQLMRERGFRVTPQRQLILDAVCAGGGHTTPGEVYGRVQATAPAISRATVYRTLDFLCELRLVVAADIGGGHWVYEMAGETPHHHLVCRQCDKVTQIEHRALADFYAAIEREHDFTIDMDHAALFGLCADCRRQASAALPIPDDHRGV